MFDRVDKSFDNDKCVLTCFLFQRLIDSSVLYFAWEALEKLRVQPVVRSW